MSTAAVSAAPAASAGILKKPRQVKSNKVAQESKPVPETKVVSSPEVKQVQEVQKTSRKKKEAAAKEPEVVAPAPTPAPTPAAAAEPAAKPSKKRKQPEPEVVATPAAVVVAAAVAESSAEETETEAKKSAPSNRISKFSDFLGSLGPIATALTSSPSVDVTKQIQLYLQGTLAQKQAAREILQTNGIALPEVGTAEHKTIVSRSTFLFKTVFEKIYEFEKEEKKRLAASRKIKRRSALKKKDDEDGTGQTYGIRNPTTRISQALANLLGVQTTLSCTELTQRISSYLNENNLRNPNDKREIIPNAALKALLPPYEGMLTCFNIHAHLLRHKSSKKTDGLVLSEIPADQAAAIEAKIASIAAKDAEKKRNKIAKRATKSDVSTESS